MITMRTEHSKQQLRYMCKYIGSIRDTKEMTLVEIGTFLGDSTEIFAKYFQNVITIDPYVSGMGDITNRVDMKEIRKQAESNLSIYNNVEMKIGKSADFVNNFPNNSIDVLYIDGGHTYEDVKLDIMMYAPKVKRNGFLCGHDYRPGKFDGVVKAVNEYKVPDKRFSDYSFIIFMRGVKK